MRPDAAKLLIEREDELVMRTVGVDIGSATTHLSISNLLHKMVGSRYVVVSRDLLHESPVMLTPYTESDSIDADALGVFVDEQYASAGISRDDVDTGALILTGVALLRSNARAIAEVFAREAGRFVAVSAGDHLEAVMAAHGSGAVEHSGRHPGTFLTVDIGGGTTKLAVCSNGTVQRTAALDVGARLVVVDADGCVCRVEASLRRSARDLGIDVSMGALLGEGERRRLARHLVAELCEQLYRCDHGEQAQHERHGQATRPSPLLRGKGLGTLEEITGVVLSGGVAEYFYGREPRSFGDLGEFLADALRERLLEAAVPLVDTGSGIRATVLGASQHTVQVSGSTIHLSSPDALPLRNVPVVLPELPLHAVDLDEAAVAAAVTSAIRSRGLSVGHGALAVAVRWRGAVTYQRLSCLARGLLRGRAGAGGRGALVVLCDEDIARLLGRRIAEAGADGDIVSVDGIDVREFDHIDVGGLLPGSASVTVVVKSLVFPNG